MSRCRVLGKGGCLGLRKSSEWQPVWPDTYGCAGILRIYRLSVYYSGQWGIYGRTSAGDNFDQQMDSSLKSGGGSGDTELAPGKQTNWVGLMFFTVAFAQYLWGFAGGRVVDVSRGILSHLRLRLRQAIIGCHSWRDLPWRQVTSLPHCSLQYFLMSFNSINQLIPQNQGCVLMIPGLRHLSCPSRPSCSSCLSVPPSSPTRTGRIITGSE
jgi:hypothetical protein